MNTQWFISSWTTITIMEGEKVFKRVGSGRYNTLQEERKKQIDRENELERTAGVRLVEKLVEKKKKLTRNQG